MEGKGTTSASIETTDVTATKDIVKTADTEPKE
jgi:hypothetical protein